MLARTMFSRSRCRPLAGWLLAAALLARPSGAQEPSPFEPGRLWTHTPPMPALPRALAFVGGGLWVASSGPAPGLDLLSTARGPATLLARLDPAWLVGASGTLEVRSGDTLDETYLLAQFVTSVPGVRRPRVLAVDPTSTVPGTPLAPRWTHEVDPRNGPARLGVSADGSLVLVAAVDAVALELTLQRLDPSLGTTLWSRSWRAGALAGPVVSEAGERVLLATGSQVQLLVGADGTTEWSRAQGQATPALALAGDGRTWAHGEGGRVLVWREAAGSVALLLDHPGRPGELPVAVALDREGASLALAWWDAASGAGVRFEWLATRDAARLGEYEQAGAGPGLQNYPSALALAADGSAAVLGLWGADDQRPEVLVFGPGAPVARWSLDLGASVEALALEERTARLAIAQRSGHANRFSLGGSVHLWETEPRDLVLLGAPRLGGSLDVALRLTDEQHGGLAAVGWPRRTALSLPAGELWLERRPAPLRLWLSPLAGAGLQAHLALPSGLELLGLELALQAVRFGPTGPRLVADVPRFTLF